jgi:N-acetylglucosaminyl-diphospho-decaprenol L-rhamnosyltransferase
MSGTQGHLALSASSEPPAASSVCIIVVSYNTRGKTLACLESIYAQADAGRVHVIVVDNDSRDGSPEAIRKTFPQADVIDSGSNLGFARAVNLGADHSDQDYLLLLNPDALLLSGSLCALMDFAGAHPQYGIYGGRIVDKNGVTDPSSCWGAPTLWSLACFATGVSTAFPRSRVFNPESLGRWQRNSVREVPVITGCLLLVRRSDFLAVGGMDRRYFLYSEDAEFCLRAKGLGLSSVVVPDAVIRHEGGAASRDNGGSKMCMVMAGKATMLRAVWPPAKAQLGVHLLRSGAGLRAALERVSGRERRMWTEVWERRAAWEDGYPRARMRLFGAPGGHLTVSARSGYTAVPLARPHSTPLKEMTK